MQTKSLTGPHASVLKYDLITALGTHALAKHRNQQRLALRLITLVTARYDWRRDELAVGQREIARLWSVTERTVKREISDLRTRGWLNLKRPAARGRVSVYRLGVEAILIDTEDSRNLVGDDFVERAERFSGRSSTTTGAGGQPENVVRVAFSPKIQQVHDSIIPEWPAILDRLRKEDEDRFANWYSRLTATVWREGVLTLTAPNAFIASYVRTHLADLLISAARLELGSSLRVVSIEAV